MASRAIARRHRELEILGAVGAELNRAVDVHAALERTLQRVAELLGLPTGWVWLLDPQTDQFYHAASLRLPPYLSEPVRMSGSWCECIGALRSGELSAQNIDVIECSRLAPAVKRNATRLTAGLRYHASVPLYFQDKPLGIMNLTGPAWRKLSSAELRLLATIGSHLGVTIERARLAEESARLARGEERTRLAREIHDTLAQSLTAVALQLESALKDLDGRSSRSRRHVGRALAITRESIAEARRSMLDLRGAPPAGEPLVQALRALARRFSSETGIRVSVHGHANIDVPAPVEAELYRIGQEALTNVRKHARATEVDISLRRRAGRLGMIIHDDGAGYDARKARRSGGHGIVGMKERARLLGGTLRISGRPKFGTTVQAQVPSGPALP